MTDEERRRLEALWRPTLVEVDGRTYTCGAANAAPPGGGFVWLTSDEPSGKLIDEAATATRRVALRGELERRGWVWSHAPSRSPDGSHQELGVAVHAAPRQDVIALARAFEQLAVFVVEDDGVMDIIWCC